MSDSDYNLALLLQRQYEQEEKKDHLKGDQQVALLLQEQFKHEDNIENPSPSLSYSKPSINNSKSLVDPSWELVDPTPNIHALFIVFNQQFFWNKLLAVCVSWSKRMTTCAGICSYNGRGGMCSITLSEPLLKLRPRKDLVETLLHEMIHAYLFVSHNNKDRDGHGPEFHKHMYRINGEAGTKISVYHSFHDEVKLYKTHWWKCDGPCQHSKPFYGIVRRATNRAPGKYDRWWDQHSKSCGGKFIKVKEPEKVIKSKNEKDNKTKSGKENKPNPKMDIRNFLNKTATPDTTKTNNIHTIHKTPTSTVSKAPVFNDNAKINNIHGFQNLSNNNNIKGGTKLNGETIVITKTKKPSTVTTNELPNTPTHFTGTGKVLNSNQTTPQDYSLVRNHWLNKFNNNSTTTNINSNKRRSGSDILESHTSPKKIKSGTECPVCNLLFELSELDKHIDECLENNLKICPECNNSIIKKDYDQHQQRCGKSDKTLTQCEICDNFVPSKTLADHMQSCLHDVSISIGNSSFGHKKCEICKEDVQEDIFDVHMEGCLMKIFDGVEDMFNSETVKCSVCLKELLRKDLKRHLDDCMNDSVLNDADDETENNKTTENNDEVQLVESEENTRLIKECDNNTVIVVEDDYINCPVCTKKVLNSTINSHLDVCLS